VIDRTTARLGNKVFGLGASHATHGWPRTDTPGLREAGTAQRNASHATHGQPREGTPWPANEQANACEGAVQS
jgi:hypothetical protein